MKGNRSLLEVRNQLSGQLLKAQELRPRKGFATGFQQLDDFLLWKGLPAGHLCLFQGEAGTGRTSLWLKTAIGILDRGGWCCWISSQYRLHPPAQFLNTDLTRLLIVHPPPDRKKVLFSLQEVCSSQLFDLVGVDVDPCELTRSDLVRLKKWARQHQVALVLISRSLKWPSELLSVIIDFNSSLLKVERALHRPVPYFVKRLHHENPVSEIFPAPREQLSS